MNVRAGVVAAQKVAELTGHTWLSTRRAPQQRTHVLVQPSLAASQKVVFLGTEHFFGRHLRQVRRRHFLQPPVQRVKLAEALLDGPLTRRLA